MDMSEFIKRDGAHVVVGTPSPLADDFAAPGEAYDCTDAWHVTEELTSERCPACKVDSSGDGPYRDSLSTEDREALSRLLAELRTWPQVRSHFHNNHYSALAVLDRLLKESP
jgi:hypothetical protein